MDINFSTQIDKPPSAWRRIYNGNPRTAYQAIAEETLVLMNQALEN